MIARWIIDDIVRPRRSVPLRRTRVAYVDRKVGIVNRIRPFIHNNQNVRWVEDLLNGIKGLIIGTESSYPTGWPKKSKWTHPAIHGHAPHKLRLVTRAFEHGSDFDIRGNQRLLWVSQKC